MSDYLTKEKNQRNAQRFSSVKPNKLVTTCMLALLLLNGTVSVLRADNGTCNGVNVTLPFLDVAGNPFFCQIAAAYFSGLTNGTTATTYSPANNVTREQMAAFTTRTLDQALKRGSQRAALGQFWNTTPHYNSNLGVTNLAGSSLGSHLKSDGTDIWVADRNDRVHRVSGGDGKLLGTWTGANAAYDVLCAMGRVFITSLSGNGNLYYINPASPPGAVTTLTENLGGYGIGIAFDGNKIWTISTSNKVAIVTPGPLLPWNVTLVSGFGDLQGIVYDGANIWVTEDGGPGSLKRLNSSGGVLQTVTLGNRPTRPVFDGKNIWVPNHFSNTVMVVRAATGEVLATLSGNGLSLPTDIAFDGERILVTNANAHTVSLWKATDLTPLGNFSTGADTYPTGVCSDGQSFWIGLQGPSQLARF
jgi:hypothetical protein